MESQRNIDNQDFDIVPQDDQGASSYDENLY
jgi:hypothetical protein